MDRRGFLGQLGLVAGGLIVAPRFGRFFREGSGLFVPAEPDWDDVSWTDCEPLELKYFEVDWSAREVTIDTTDVFWSRAVEEEVRAQLQPDLRGVWAKVQQQLRAGFELPVREWKLLEG